jgi:hypothetical protein
MHFPLPTSAANADLNRARSARKRKDCQFPFAKVANLTDSSHFGYGAIPSFQTVFFIFYSISVIKAMTCVPFGNFALKK